MASEDYSQHALFMDSLPADLSSDVTLSALQSLNEDLRSLKDSAAHWKAVGNDNFQEALTGRKKRFFDAIDAYSRGLECFDKFGPTEKFAEAETALRCQLYTNRANARLKVGQYVECVDDCRAAIALDPSYVKAYYHAARGSQKLELYQQCVDFCERSLQHDATRSLQKLKDEMEQKLVDIRTRKESQRKEASRTNQLKLVEALKRERDVDYIDSSRFEISSLSGDRRPRIVQEIPPVEIEWPILLLIEKYGVCEAATNFNDREPLIELLKLMFPGNGQFAKWDHEQTFSYGNLDCFFEEDHCGCGANTELKIDLWKPFQNEIKKISFVYKFIVLLVKEKQQ